MTYINKNEQQQHSLILACSSLSLVNIASCLGSSLILVIKLNITYLYTQSEGFWGFGEIGRAHV